MITEDSSYCLIKEFKAGMTSIDFSSRLREGLKSQKKCLIVQFLIIFL